MRNSCHNCRFASRQSTPTRTSTTTALRWQGSSPPACPSLVCPFSGRIGPALIHHPAGVYLTTLTFINDGAGDKLSGNMINFRKRQKAAEVIQDIKRWQAVPYNFQTVASVLSYLEDSFQAYQDGVDYGDQFWNLSLEREPREREDEKMARLLQESGFL